MSRAARLHRVLALLVVLLLCPAQAWAHKLNVFAHVEGRTIHGAAYFGSGTAAQGVSVVAFDSAGKELGRTTTDSQGLFSLEAHRRCDHRLVVETADGHGAEYTIPAAELPADLPAGKVSAMPAKSTAGPIAATSGATAGDETAAKLDALHAEVVRLREQARPVRAAYPLSRRAGRDRFHPGNFRHRILFSRRKAEPSWIESISPRCTCCPPAWLATPAISSRVDPRARVVAAAVFSLVVAAVHGWAALVVALAAAVLGIAWSGLSPAAVLRRMLPLEALLLLLILILPAGGEHGAHFGPMVFSHAGLVLGLRIALKGNALVLGLLALLGTMDAVTLGHALGHLRVPHKLALLLLFTVRYLDVLQREYRRLRASMKVRGFRPRMNRHTYRAYGYLIGMLLVRSFDRSERIVAAMKCRGFRGHFYLLNHFCYSAPRSALLPRWIAVVGLAGPGELAMSDALVEMQDVKFSYGPDRPVLDGCSFRLETGQRLALLGPNGSGKTTLLHLVVGLLRPAAGRIEAFGKVRREEADFHEVRRRAGLLFQEADDQLFCPSVAEDVAFGPLNLGKPRDEVRRIVTHTLQSLGLHDYEHRITYRLSGGEKRLVALATVLAMQPDVLLLDEPTSELDEAASRTPDRAARRAAAGNDPGLARSPLLAADCHRRAGTMRRATGGGRNRLEKFTYPAATPARAPRHRSTSSTTAARISPSSSSLAMASSTRAAAGVRGAKP